MLVKPDVRYEDLTDNTETVLKQIQDFIPELDDLSADKTFLSHNVTGSPIKGVQNLNERKIALLKSDDIARINKVLGRNEDIMRTFGYKLIYYLALPLTVR